MNGKTYAYLDLAALPAVGAVLLNPSPAWVFRGDGTAVLWANAAGARLFRAKTMGALLARRLGAANPLIGQLSRLAKSLPADAPRLEILRLSAGFSLTTVAAACQRLNLADGGAAVLAVAVGDFPAKSIASRAESLADTLAGEDCLAAIIGADGEIVGASGGFRDLAPASAEIDALVAAVEDGNTRIIKHSLAVSGTVRPAGAARFTVDGEDYALLIVGAADTMPTPADVAEKGATPPTPAEADAAPAPAPQKPGIPTVLRFLWQMDANQRFTFVSDELAATVGARHADIVGKTWADVGKMMPHDADIAVQAALDRRAQWGGITVTWPAGASGLADAGTGIAVTMSAFPVDDRGRFMGFRGLGVARLDQRRPLPPRLAGRGRAGRAAEVERADRAARVLEDERIASQSWEGENTPHPGPSGRPSPSRGEGYPAETASIDGEHRGAGEGSDSPPSIPAPSGDPGATREGGARGPGSPIWSGMTGVGGEPGGSPGPDTNDLDDAARMSIEQGWTDAGGVSDELEAVAADFEAAAEAANGNAADAPPADWAEAGASAAEAAETDGGPSNVVPMPGAADKRPPGQERLSGNERDAFRRIAESLGARTHEGDAKERRVPREGVRRPVSGDTSAPAKAGGNGGVAGEEDGASAPRTARGVRTFDQSTGLIDPADRSSPSPSNADEPAFDSLVPKSGKPDFGVDDGERGRSREGTDSPPSVPDQILGSSPRTDPGATRGDGARGPGSPIRSGMSGVSRERGGSADSEAAAADGELAPAPLPDTAILDRLPLGLMVIRGEETLYANAALAELVGYDGRDDLLAAGGHAALFAKGDADRSDVADGQTAGGLVLRRKDGGTVAVAARLQSVTWGDAPAVMLSLSAAGGEDYPSPGALRAPPSPSRGEGLTASADTAGESRTDRGTPDFGEGEDKAAPAASGDGERGRSGEDEPSRSQEEYPSPGSSLRSEPPSPSPSRQSRPAPHPEVRARRASKGEAPQGGIAPQDEEEGNAASAGTGSAERVHGDAADNAEHHVSSAEADEARPALAEELAAASEDLASTREELAATRDTLVAARQDLATTREDLAAIRDTLVAAHEELATGREELAGARHEAAASRDRLSELETILDTATDGVVVIDADGTIISLNRSAEALFGTEAGDVAGGAFVDLFAEESHKGALDYLDGLASNGVVSVLNDGREVIGKVPTGGLIPLFMTMGRLGRTGKFCAVLRDITHWKTVEEELVSARRAAEAASSQKSEFLAKISHEIRTPLNAIIGFSEVMMEERFGPIGNKRYRDYLRDIHVSGSHLMSLINDLLDLSKIEAGKLDLAFEAVAVNGVIQDCVALMQPQANRGRIIIRTSLAASLPQVVADPRSLRQILLNLLSNAIKFTNEGGQVIVSTASEETGEVAIRVRDTGVGMNAEDIETALKPFRQLATTGRERDKGTGLGLPLTKALVEANRATFSIDSAVNQGTLVKITFPNTRVLAG